MGILAEVERAQEQDRRRRERERQMDAIVSGVLKQAEEAGLLHDESVLLVGRIASALEGRATKTVAVRANGAKHVASDALVEVAVAALAETKKTRVLAMLQSAEEGLSVPHVAIGVYGAADKSACHRARSALGYLARCHEAHEANGLWFAGRGEVGRTKTKKEGKSATPLVRRVLGESTSIPLTVAEIVAGVLALNAHTPKAHIYSAIYKGHARQEFVKMGDRYAVSQSYRGRVQ